MTTPELDPSYERDLRQTAELKTSAELAAIDVYANDYLDKTFEEEMTSEFAGDVISFVTRLVSYSSKNADADTGCIPVAKFDLSQEKDQIVDKIGLAFLSSNEEVIRTDQETTDKYVIDKFKFTQLRKSGNNHAVTIHRRSLIEPVESNTVEYFIRVIDLGKPHPDPEGLLDQGRALIGKLGENTLAMAGDVARKPFDRAVRFGHAISQLVLPNQPE